MPINSESDTVTALGCSGKHKSPTKMISSFSRRLSRLLFQLAKTREYIDANPFGGFQAMIKKIVAQIVMKIL